MREASVGAVLQKIGSTLWATVLAFLLLALPAQAVIGSDSDTLWIRLGGAALLGVGFVLRHPLRSALRGAGTVLLSRFDRRPATSHIVMALADPPHRRV